MGLIDKSALPLPLGGEFRLALRYGILLSITGNSFRKLSRQVAESLIFQWFTHTSFVDGVRPVSKSALERFEKIFPDGELATLIHELTGAAADQVAASELETQIVLERIQGILDQLPQAIHQAYERIIGERRVPNKEKILSLYDPDAHVLVRGKANAETEFGNGLYLAEQAATPRKKMIKTTAPIARHDFPSLETTVSRR